MENVEPIRKMPGSRKTKKFRTFGEEDTSKRTPLRQLQFNVSRNIPVTRSSTKGKKKDREENAQFSKSYNKADTPIKGVDNVDASLPAVNKVDSATATVNKVDASCQVDDPTELPIEDLYTEKPSEKYWELFAKSRSDMLEDERKKNEKLSKEIEQLKEQVKALEDKNNDLEYFAMMYKLALPRN